MQGQAVLQVRLSGLGLLMPGVADHAPDHAAQRIRVGMAQRPLVGADGFDVLLRVAHHMPFGEVEIDLRGDQLQGAGDVFVDRVGVLEVAFDVDHRPEILFRGRLVGEVALVEREGLLQFARSDQVAGVKLHDALVVGIADGQRRGQVVQLKVIFAVEARVGGELPEAFDLGFERQFVGLEQLPRDGQQRPVILPSGVKIGQRHQRLYVCGVDLQRAVVFGAGQRILLGDGVEVAEDHVALRLIGGSFDHRPGFDHGFVDLVRRHQQTPFHGAQHGNAPEAQFGRIECHEGHDGTLLLLVEGRQNAVVVGVFRVLRLQAAVDLQRLVVTPGVDERLSVELVIPLVRRVEPESLPGQFHGLVGRGVHAVRREFVVGRGVGRVVADRLEEQLPGAHRVSGDGILLDAFGVEPYAAQRIGVFGRRRGTLSRDERRGEEQKAEDRCRCEAFHGRQGV